MPDIEHHDVLGAIGSLLIIACYLLIQLRRMSSQSLQYSALNGLGAALILYSLYFEFNFSAVVIESFWVLISVVGIVRFFRDRRAEAAGSAGA